MRGSNIEPRIPYDDLRQWIAEADRLGELRTVTGATWQEDIGLAAEAVLRADDGPAVLFDEVPGCAKGFRLLMNIFAGRRRNMTFGFPDHYTKQELSSAYFEAYLQDHKTIPHEVVDDGPVFENVLTGDDVDLNLFPAPIWHEKDGGRYIGTGCYSVTRDPDDNWLNLGTYRAMLHDRRTVGVLMVPGKHGHIHREKYFARGEKLPLVMVLGGDPMAFFYGGFEAPYGVCELDIIGGMRGHAVKVVEGPITGLPFPADAEIVLEGYVDIDRRVVEGPFGEWTGHYAGGATAAPVLEVEAIYHRNDPILLGVPPMGKGAEEMSRYRAVLRSAVLKQNMADAGVPDVSAVWCHEIGGARMLNGIAITQRYPGHATQAGHIASQCRAAAYGGKFIVVVDDDVDVTNLEELIWAMITRSDPATSIDIIHNAWASPADPRVTPAQRAAGDLTNSRAVIDACRPYHWRDRFPRANAPSIEAAKKAREKFGFLLGQ
jgi:4-hydroxy-3-polyprenylbenzoate decarboxylase